MESQAAQDSQSELAFAQDEILSLVLNRHCAELRALLADFPESAWAIGPLLARNLAVMGALNVDSE